jgi:signal transduction histidine kinase
VRRRFTNVSILRLTANRFIPIKSDRNHNDVFSQIRDSGEGIDPRQEEHIVESFFSAKPEGVGIGLSIKRSVVVRQWRPFVG